MLYGGSPSYVGGVNRTIAEDLVEEGQVYEAKNARVGRARFGSAEKRGSTQRIHETSLGASVQGMFQWITPGGVSQVLAVAGGDLFYMNSNSGTFTEVTVGGPTTDKVDFAIHRELESDGITVSQRVYFTFSSGSGLYSWDGTSVRDDVATNGAPDGLSRIEVFNTRLFGIEANSDRLYWSGINDPAQWNFPDAGAADISVLDTDNLVGIKPVRASLALVKNRSTSRFTGYDSRDIQINSETEGIAPATGCISAPTIIQVEDIIFMLSEEGPYLVTEGAVRYVGQELEDIWDNMDVKNGDHFAVHLKKRREILLFVDHITLGQQCWVYNYRLKNWWGPWEFSFTATCASVYEDSSGRLSAIVGGSDGFVRNVDADTGDSRDDVLFDGTGGTAITMEITHRDDLFGSLSSYKVGTTNQDLIADLGAQGQVEFLWSSESGDGNTLISTDGPGLREYRFRPAMKGRRITVTLRDQTRETVRLNALILRAKQGGDRPF